jgi:hypothetical protein
MSSFVSTQREFKTNTTKCSPENQQKKKKEKLPVELLYFWTSANCSPKDQDSQLSSGALLQ